jgi:guanine deaminase
MTATPAPRLQAFRGHLVHCLADPADQGPGALEHFPDGLLVLRDGHVAEIGPAAELLAKLPAGTPWTDHRGHYLLPGLIDTHVHYAQTDIIASHGAQLLEWLERYTFPAEAAFADPAHAAEVAEFFTGQLLANGTTTAAVFATVHPASVDAIFAAAQARGMRLIAGKCLMDRHCPAFLRDTAEGGIADSRALIEKWHGVGRLGYAVTPRFAPTSSDAQMRLAGELIQAWPGLHLQTHVAENQAEVRWVAELYPRARSYLDVYERFGHLGPRSVLAHCLWLDDTDRARMAATGTAMSFCPTSNLFLGSGLFDLAAARRHGVRVGLGTDVGGGTSLSMLQTLNEAYKVLHLQGQSLSAPEALYLATLGGARALYLEDRIGNLAPGKEADFIALDPAATPLLARRTARAASLEEALFALIMLGDDRAVAASYLMGREAWRRTENPDP